MRRLRKRQRARGRRRRTVDSGRDTLRAATGPAIQHPAPAREGVDHRGRKHLSADERIRFLAAVRAHPKPTVQPLARTLALTGCQVSESLGTRACDIDIEAAELRITTLKRRRAHWRAVPVLKDLVGFHAGASVELGTHASGFS